MVFQKIDHRVDSWKGDPVMLGLLRLGLTAAASPPDVQLVGAYLAGASASVNPVSGRTRATGRPHRFPELLDAVSRAAMVAMS
jgi:hypothetical protein